MQEGRRGGCCHWARAGTAPSHLIPLEPRSLLEVFRIITTMNPKTSSFCRSSCWNGVLAACMWDETRRWLGLLLCCSDKYRSLRLREEPRPSVSHPCLLLFGLCSVQGHWKLNHTLYGFLGQQVRGSADGPSSPAPQLVIASIWDHVDVTPGSCRLLCL